MPEIKSGFITVGKVKDAHGIRGELFIVMFKGSAELVEDLETVRLVSPEGAATSVQEFKVKSIRAHKNGVIVKSEEIKDRNHAEALKGKLLEIPESLLVSKPGETVFLREVLGFEVSTKEKGPIGRVSEFSSNGAQDLLVVKSKSATYEIPFVDAFVTKIDYEAKTILMDLPLGLLGELDDEEVEIETDAGAYDETDEELPDDGTKLK